VPAADEALAVAALIPVLPEEVRSIQHTFPLNRLYPVASGLPRNAAINKKIFFKRTIVTTYTIHKAYFTDDHYHSFTDV
jgi:hypothetical protein